MFKIITGFIGWVMSPIMSVLDLLPGIPPEVISVIESVFGYMSQGMCIVNFFCPVSVISPAITVWFTVFVVKHSYDLVMWVLRKIPMLSID